MEAMWLLDNSPSLFLLSSFSLQPEAFPISLSCHFFWQTTSATSPDERPLPSSSLLCLSFQPNVSLSLSHPLTHTLFLLIWVTTTRYDHQRWTFILEHVPELWVQRLSKKMGGALHDVGRCCWRWWQRIAKPQLNAIVSPSLATVGGISQFHEVLFDPTIVTVPLVHDESDRILKHLFGGKLSKL